MIPELGLFSLTLALAAALVQSIFPMVGAARNNVVWMRMAMPTAVLQAVLIGIAFAALMRSFIVSDFSVLNVVENSHSLKPMLFKIAGTWGSHEGSLLLWVFILAIFGGALALLGGNIPLGLKARTLSVQAWISVGFLSFLLFTSNPFARVLNPPLNGNDLNPLLQDIGLALHPPLLYLGYVGFSIVFSFAVAALIEGRIEASWARLVRPWVLSAWISLTGGIALGSWWAYYELGWGGWWFWDPVENVSFMPWLLATALVHSILVTEKRDTFKIWTILLAILTFSLSLLGTFIVRSGLLTSVHAFAVDPERGIYILVLLGIAIGGSLSLFALRASAMEPGGVFANISRETGLMINNLLLATGAATVLVGTLYPLFLEAFNGAKISVGPPFFNASFIPIMMPLIIMMGIGPLLSWKRADLGAVLIGLKWVAALTGLAVLIMWYFNTKGPVLAIIAIGAAIWVLLATVKEWGDRVKLFDGSLATSWRRARNLPRSSYGMRLAHIGLALCIFGFVGSSAWKKEIVSFVRPGSIVELAGFKVKFNGIERYQGANFISEKATLIIMKNGAEITRLYPERRHYLVAGTSTTESAIRQTIAGDLYTSIVKPSADSNSKEWILRIIYEPLVNFIWFGVICIILGGMCSLSDRRLRIGAPRKFKGEQK